MVITRGGFITAVLLPVDCIHHAARLLNSNGIHPVEYLPVQRIEGYRKTGALGSYQANSIVFSCFCVIGINGLAGAIVIVVIDRKLLFAFPVMIRAEIGTPAMRKCCRADGVVILFRPAPEYLLRFTFPCKSAGTRPYRNR